MQKEKTMEDLISRQGVIAKDTNVPSNDFISRQAAIDAVYYAHGTGMALKAIKQLPSAQPERKTGHWIIAQDKDGNTFGECSSCGMKQYAGTLRYCPYCGADMRGEQDDEVGSGTKRVHL